MTYTQLKIYKKSYRANFIPEKYGLHKPTKKLKMPTLKYRRLKGDMTEVFKIINGIYDSKVVTDFFELSDVEQTTRN